MHWYRYRFQLEEERREELLAFLSQLPFASFEETDEGLNAYLEAGSQTDELDRRLDTLRDRYLFQLEQEALEARNWNEIWESNFSPIRIGRFCAVRADFHAPIPDVDHEIIINPKMAFGTGHHDTTYMMMQMMERLPLRGAKVLDYGCGTGILSILAERLGALFIDALDIERAAYDNTLENLQINAADRVQVHHGDLQVILEAGYDLVLANINRNVILEVLSPLYSIVRSAGILLISGILITDEPRVLEAAAREGFTADEKLERGDWLCVKFVK